MQDYTGALSMQSGRTKKNMFELKGVKKNKVNSFTTVICFLLIMGCIGDSDVVAIASCVNFH